MMLNVVFFVPRETAAEAMFTGLELVIDWISRGVKIAHVKSLAANPLMV
jgi:hypothetical protein